MADLSVTYDHTGLQRLLSHFGRTCRVAIAESVNEVMERVFIESQKLVPVDTGALKASGHVIFANPLEDMPTATIVYGNEDVTYATYVHENLFDHHEPPTQAKFVETPFAENRGELTMLLAENLKKGWLELWR